MKIVDIAIKREDVDGVQMLTCIVTPQRGELFGCSVPWLNERGLWPSLGEARDPAEIAAWLRNFARAIDQYAQAEAA
jgi:hypothetical protein